MQELKLRSLLTKLFLIHNLEDKMVVLYILLAILVFGFMILVHELGHFAFAKLFKVEINEFSIGMGPKIFSKRGKDGVLYSLRVLPIGGFVAMEGESEESESPNAFTKKPAWQRFVIVIAGALVNILVGAIIMTCVTASQPYYGSTVVDDFMENAVSYESGLRANDKIIKIGNERIYTYSELSYEITRCGNKPVRCVVLRDEKEVTLTNFSFKSTDESGLYAEMDFFVKGEHKSFNTLIKNSYGSIKTSIKMVWDSLVDLLSGKYGIDQVSGPIGVTGAISQAAQVSAYSFFFLIVVISMNLGIFNLLPIPALDGGTLVFLLIEMITRKKVPENVENGFRIAGYILLFGLIIIVTFKDIVNLFV